MMNDLYVSIKVDREERPDVDAIYMAAVQALTGSGGWPMSVWLTPDREPFFGGTYFPPRDGARGATPRVPDDPARRPRHLQGRSGARRARVGGAGQRRALAHRGGPAPRRAPAGRPARVADRRHAHGLQAPVRRPRRRRCAARPSSPRTSRSASCCARTRGAQDGVALLMAALTLEKMAAGGMYDQLAGGFHRYSTDARWLVPHFEKMLYDNALLAVAYAEAWQVTGRDDFARVARDTLDYLLREMTAPDGGFYSATDADSKRPDGKSEEGAFFVWSEAEIRQHPRRRPGDRSLHPLLRRDRRRETSRARTSSPSPRPTSASTPRWPRSARRCTRRGCAGRRRFATRRSSPPGTAWRSRRSRWAAACSTSRATSTPPRARRRSCSTRCAPAAGWRAAPRTAASAPPASSTTTRSRARG